MIIRLLLLVFFTSCVNFSFGQNDNPQLKNVIPPSPTVASLGKYGEIPVGLHTGVPNISIPLYEIKEGPLSVPISLSYHAAGIRVEEIASNVGLGWTLNAGGVLGRQIRGIEDEAGWIKQPQSRISSIIASQDWTAINDMSVLLEYGGIDGEADLYYYNYNGRTGKFLFDEDGTLYNYPKENVSIQPLGGTNYYGTGWEVIAEDGTIYEFNTPELVYTSTCIGCEPSEKYTAWYLTKITSADGKRHIDFIYDFISYNVEMPVGETRNYTLNQGNCLPPFVSTVSNSLYNTYQLSSIEFSGGHVDFEYLDEAREDLVFTDILNKIKVFASGPNGDQLIKSYELGHGYFGANKPTAYEKRLKLTSLTETTPSGTKPPHLFTYEESIDMPHRFSPNKDHWGYFNGANNTTTIPKANTVYNHGPYADRSANAATMQACILKQITYPTGGHTLFTYETNLTTDPRMEPTEYDETYYNLSDDVSWDGLNSPYETTTFVVPEGDGVEVKFSISGLVTGSSGPFYNCDNFQWTLLKDGSPTTYSGNIPPDHYDTSRDNFGLDGVTLDLDPGTYKFEFDFYGCFGENNLKYNIGVTVKAPAMDEEGEVLRHVGGLRISQMVDDPEGDGTPVVKNYRYPVGGTLVTIPDYRAHEMEIKLTRMEQIPGAPSGQAWCVVYETCNYWIASSTTNYPLATTNGSYVGYSTVIEDLGDNGEIEHHYNAYTTVLGQYPFPPLNLPEWSMGREQQTDYYRVDYIGGNKVRTPQKSVSYGYTGLTTDLITNYRSSSTIRYIGCNLSTSFNFIEYYVVPQFYYLSSMTEKVYDQDDPGKFVETRTDYGYDPDHYQQTEVVTTVSGDGGALEDQLVVKRKFPQDYITASASGSEALGIQTLNDLHVVNVPIEEYVFRQKRDTLSGQLSDQHVVSGTITTFKPFDPYPDKIFRLERNGAMSLSGFGTGSTLVNNVFVKNTNPTINGSYTPAIEFATYDSDGNLASQRMADGTHVYYIWGYNGQYPIAKIENFSTSQASAVQASLIDPAVNASNMDVSPATEDTLRTKLGDLRTATALSGAMVTTYTYDPLVGVTSVTDPRGQTVYYEYDGFNRLKAVRDANGKILSTNEYHYRGQ